MSLRLSFPQVGGEAEAGQAPEAAAQAPMSFGFGFGFGGGGETASNRDSAGAGDSEKTHVAVVSSGLGGGSAEKKRGSVGGETGGGKGKRDVNKASVAKPAGFSDGVATGGGGGGGFMRKRTAAEVEAEWSENRGKMWKDAKRQKALGMRSAARGGRGGGRG